MTHPVSIIFLDQDDHMTSYPTDWNIQYGMYDTYRRIEQTIYV